MVATSRVLSTLLMACALFLSSPAGAGADDFWMLFQNHRVTLTARDVTVSRILARWSEIGGTVVVNGAAVQGGPIALQLTDVPEREALEILLRSVGGYIVVERDDDSAGASSIGKILILPRSAPSRNQPTMNPSAFDSARNTQPVDAPVEQAFVPTTTDTFQPGPQPLATPEYVPPGSLPIPVLPAGTARPGEATAQVPALFRPGTTPSGRPGQAAPLMPMIQVTGPGSTPPPAVVPGAP